MFATKRYPRKLDGIVKTVLVDHFQAPPTQKTEKPERARQHMIPLFVRERVVNLPVRESDQSNARLLLHRQVLCQSRIGISKPELICAVQIQVIFSIGSLNVGVIFSARLCTDL